jgi:hypothetical protein
VIRSVARFLRRLFRRWHEEEDGMPLYAPLRDGRMASGFPKIAVGEPRESAIGAAAGPAGAGGIRAAAPAGALAAAQDSPRPAVDKQVMQRFQKSIRALITVYVPPETKIDAVLADLIEKWNPLLEPGPKEDLVHDVNALAQDFVRPIRRNFILTPPDLNRVKSLAEQLSASKSLAKIRKREPLMRYLELYVLRTLLG